MLWRLIAIIFHVISLLKRIRFLWEKTSDQIAKLIHISSFRLIFSVVFAFGVRGSFFFVLFKKNIFLNLYKKSIHFNANSTWSIRKWIHQIKCENFQKSEIICGNRKKKSKWIQITTKVFSSIRLSIDFLCCILPIAVQRSIRMDNIK